VVLGFGIAGLAALAPARAHACSCAPEPILSSRPVDGATAVPIDIAPLIVGPFDPDTVTFEREDGTPVAFELRVGKAEDLCSGSNGELVPSAALEPDTVYVIRAERFDEEMLASTVRIRTGQELVPELPLQAPRVEASFIRGNPILDSCGGEVRGCLALAGAEHFELTVKQAEQELVRTFVSGSAAQIYSLLVEPDCIEVRARDLAGRRSAATILCGDELHVRDGRRSDFTDEGLRCQDGVIGDPEPADAGHARTEVELSPGRAGCAVARRPGDAPAAALLWPLLALLLRRWPRRLSPKR
jgi:hypothetical protein